MTERLSELMRRAADGLVVPAAPSAEVLRHARAVRRRRHATTAAGVAAVVVLAGGAGLVARGDGPPGERRAADDPVPAAPGPEGAVFSIGTTVYLDGGARTATIADHAIKSMYYTSAGVVVRHGNNDWSDGGGPMRFSLVAPDGSVHPLDVTFEETVPSTDPTQPYLAYAQRAAGVVQVVVLDVRDGSEVARVPVPDVTSWGGWAGPPVSLDGDVVYVGTDDGALVIDWRTGDVSPAPQLGPGMPDVHGGHAVVYDGDHPAVVDLRTGETLLRSAGREYLTLSPDGRYAIQHHGRQVRAVDLDDHSVVTLTDFGGTGAVGWTPDDALFTLDGADLVTCAADSGECTKATLDLAVQPDENQSDEDWSDDLRLGGVTYES